MLSAHLRSISLLKLIDMGLSLAEQLQLVFFHSSGVKKSELAQKLGMSPQAFSGKLKRGSFSLEELKQIGDFTGCRFVQYFELPNGQHIGYSE